MPVHGGDVPVLADGVGVHVKRFDLARVGAGRQAPDAAAAVVGALAVSKRKRLRLPGGDVGSYHRVPGTDENLNPLSVTRETCYL